MFTGIGQFEKQYYVICVTRKSTISDTLRGILLPNCKIYMAVVVKLVDVDWQRIVSNQGDLTGLVIDPNALKCWTISCK
ncbi:hypothetical protein WSO01_01850 [Weissella soli]|nr:hypothetical protein WSO01_01850 [Weissella soli]